MAFRFPSISSLAKNALSTLLRFPVPVLYSLVAACCFIIHEECDWEIRRQYDYLAKAAVLCWPGLVFSLALALFFERMPGGKRLSLIAQAGSVIIIVAYFLLLPGFNMITDGQWIRYALFVLAAHLMVAVLPFTLRGSRYAFWKYNETLFINIVISGIFSVVLFGGLALALYAVEELFNLKSEIKDNYYLYLWIMISLVFNTWHFLSGIPSDPDSLEEEKPFPKPLRILSQYILLPIVTVYLVILYAYYVKIGVQWELPSGWVGWLVSGFSVAGIFSLLLVDPIRLLPDYRWINVFNRVFYIALLPLSILLALAIYQRVHQYGITEPRYFLIVIALWLPSIALYLIFSKSKNIRVIPVSLMFIALLSTFGPWGAFRVSERSQMNRLEKMFTDTKRFDGLKLLTTGDTLKDDKAHQIYEILDYLEDHHGLKGFSKKFQFNIDSLADLHREKYSLKPEDRVVLSPLILEALNIKYIPYMNWMESEGLVENFQFDYYEQNPLPVSGFDMLMQFNGYYRDLNFGNSGVDYIVAGEDTIRYNWNELNHRIRIYDDSGDIAIFDLMRYVGQLRNHAGTTQGGTYSKIPDSLRFCYPESGNRAALIFSNINGNQTGGHLNLNYIHGYLLMKAH